MGKTKHGSKAVNTEQKLSRAKAGSTSSSRKPWSLADYGLRVETVKADGNCFFRAVAAQLEGLSGDHMVYRQNTVSFMRQHRDDFEPFMEDEEDFERYCSRMAQDGTWAGQQEQVALARRYGLMIRVYQAEQPAWTIKPDTVPEGSPLIHLSYHDGEHYNSLRLASDTGTGVPKPITLQERPASAKDWTSFGPAQIELVMQGTGCYDNREAVQSALQDARGASDEAIELLIERLAAQAVQKQDKQDASSAVHARPAVQAEATALASSTETPAVPQAPRRDAREADAQASPPEQQLPEGLGPDEHLMIPESCVSTEAEYPIAEEASAWEQKDISPALASPQDGPGVKNRLCSMECVKGSVSCGSTQQDEEQCKQETDKPKDSKAAGKHAKKPARNRPCPCGSGRRYKECCGPVQAAQQRRQTNGLQPPEPVDGPRHVIAELYV